jgi:prepilin-type N-terminal cleavage/methylation domain-containing protein
MRGKIGQKNSGGFTLIELIVVIVIIGILVGFVVVSMNRTAPDSVNACRAQMQSWLEAQAVQADVSGRTVYIVGGDPAPSALILVADVAAPKAEPSAAATDSTSQAPANPQAQSTRSGRTAQNPLRAQTISTLNWPSGCRLVAPSANGTPPFETGDPRAQAILAVTSGGVWSAPMNLNAGKPIIQVQGAPSARGAPNPPQEIDLRPAPVNTTTTGTAP